MTMNKQLQYIYKGICKSAGILDVDETAQGIGVDVQDIGTRVNDIGSSVQNMESHVDRLTDTLTGFLEDSRARARRATMGATVGGVTGAGLGGLATWKLSRQFTRDRSERLLLALLGTGIFGAAGAAAGGLAGGYSGSLKKKDA